MCAALLIIFHRPILLAIGRQLVLRYAARENLKIDFRLEGNPFSHLTVRNFRALPTGTSAIESIDIDQLYVDYSLFGLTRHGLSHFLEDVELRSAQVVLNPARAPPRKPRPKQKLTLPSIFPERIRLADVTLVIRNKPNDFVVEHVDLDLNPRSPGEVRIEKLQLPSGDSWSRISGQASYANKNLVLRDLVLSDQEQIRLLNIDASRIDDKTLGLKLDCAIGGGQLSAAAALTETESSLNAKINVAAQKIAAESLNKFLFLPEDSLSGTIERLAVDGAGTIDVPRTWSGAMSLQISNVDRPEIHFDSGVVEVSAEQGRATLRSADIVQDKNELHFRGTMELPSVIEDFGRTPTTLEITGTAPDLQRVTTGIPVQLTGSAQFTGKIDIVNAKIEATLGMTGESIGFPDGTIEKLSSTLRASKTIARPDTRPGSPPPATAKRAWFADLRTAMEFDLAGIHYQDHIIDSVQGSLNGSDDILGLDRLSLRRNQNELNVRGRYKLPEEVGKAPSQPADLDVALNAPELGDFWVADSPNKLSGPLQMTAQIEWRQQTANGQVSISGSNLKMRDLVFHELSTQCSISDNIVYLNDCRASLNDSDFFYATGRLNLRQPHHYNGKVSASIANLSTLQPLLRTFGNQNELAGSVTLDWEGNGDAQISRSSGNLKVVLEKGRYGNTQSLRANIDASYSPDGLDVPIIFFATGNSDFQAVAQAKGETLEITRIQLDQGQARFASGYISFPLVWRNLGTNAPIIPSSGKVFATIQSENLDLKKLFSDLGIKAGTSGTLSARLDADGTIGDLNARLDLQMRDLRNDRWPKMEPATFVLNAQAVHDRLAVLGKLQQARIQPLELNADVPFDIPKIARARKLPDDTPITAKARLPRSSVNFVRQFVPALEQLDGNLGLDVDVSGTIGKPVFSGAGDMTVNVARFTNATLPALTNFSARLSFAQNALSLERFGGDLAGGPFTMSGRVTFPKLTEPTLDLQLKANSVLVARNDTLTARADADITVKGPFATATVSGNVAMTNSHILKNIDLIPIGLPGRPAPEPPSERPQFSFPDPPLRDWKFDVAIKTKDPVLIRGNLATGSAIADIKLTGTGLHPELQGTVRLENVEATLPFSRLEVSQGFLYFDPSDSMNPRLELRGTSVIRDYTVRVYVYGTVLAPEAIFTSEPPLPQEEIISLIATGATRQELSGRGNVLAGRAAMLLVQQLYRKIFKKGEATQSNELFNRLDLDVGAVDPRTGRQQVSARFKISDQFVLVGDVGVGGDYRGMLKYLIRFR
ncbi:MAG: TamB, inner membrane protein subunit of TAM complex [Candidatus Udaeobacter sp.]|nr:MAG: TamB, inner membrane protein subunit of TAM complex [Candidatus Udaeobacter sp.]